MYIVYVLALSNSKLYKGYTTNLSRRVKEHQSGNVKSTKGYLPVKLIHYETYMLKSDALRREKFLKTTEGRRLLQKQIRDTLLDLN